VRAHLAEWLGLALRWGHVIAGIAWIGTSFYFNWLNGRMAAPARSEPGVSGELWSVHGGGFYRVVKYDVAPERLPATLHWFKWEAYFTWITGFLLLGLIYYLQADAYLGRAGTSASAAVGIGLATLPLSWLAYDAVCRSALARAPVALGVALFALFTMLAWGLTQVMSPRAAYLHVGAAIGTIMAANVFRVIIPSQQHMVDALIERRRPDAALGREAALRSLHNNYFTLPVVFTMVSSHYPTTYGHAWGWAVLVGLALVGVGTRHWFTLRNQGRRAAWLLPAAALALVTLALATAPRTGGGVVEPAPDSVSFAAVRVVMAERCAPCHSSAPTMPGHSAPAAGIPFDTPEQIRAQVDRILAAAVTAETMPLGNVTGMTGEERALLGRWIRSGARLGSYP
jgi:uncharacterized membrane protein